MNVIIEMPKGTNLKLEMNKTTGRLELDRVLYVRCPANYGYIPDKMSADGDNLDAFVIGPELPPGQKVNAEPFYRIKCLDKGVEDDKIVLVVNSWSADYEAIWHRLGEIINYLLTYKEDFKIVGVELYEETA